MKRFKEFLNLLVEASEGDARKYMKKVLTELGLDKEFEAEYGEHWSEQIFNEIRSTFIHNGCDVYFAPGLARIAYGELDMGTDDEDTTGIRQLCQLVRFITMAHKTDFSRNLEQITVVQQGPNRGQKVKSEPVSLEQLANMFGKVQQQMTNDERNDFDKSQKTDNGYTIIELNDFETAHKYLPYTDLPGGDSWCYLESEETFNSYRRRRNKLYLALAPGFEKLKPGDKGYGRSMIGFDMSPIDENGYSNLEVCNNRYNHAEDLEHENNKTGDAKYNEIELSKILGFPVWKRCPGYTPEELAKLEELNIVSKQITPELCYNSILPLLDDFKAAFKQESTYKINEAIAEIFENFDGGFDMDCFTNGNYLRDSHIGSWKYCQIACKTDMDDLEEDGVDMYVFYNTKTDKILLTTEYERSYYTDKLLLVMSDFNAHEYDVYYEDNPTPIASHVYAQGTTDVQSVMIFKSNTSKDILYYVDENKIITTADIICEYLQMNGPLYVELNNILKSKQLVIEDEQPISCINDLKLSEIYVMSDEYLTPIYVRK
jgi:hypothetical protein